MNSGETRKYIVPMTGMGIRPIRPSITEEEQAVGDWVLETKSASVKSYEVTFTPAPEFIRAPLTEEEQAKLARLCELTRGDV